MALTGLSSGGLSARVGKYSHVHPFGLPDQFIDRVLRPELPGALLRMADENLCDALLAREADDLGDGIRLAFDDMHLGAKFAREVKIFVDRFLGLPGEIALLHIDGQQLSVKSLGRARAAFEHLPRTAAGCDASQNAFLRAPISEESRGGKRW